MLCEYCKNYNGKCLKDKQPKYDYELELYRCRSFDNLRYLNYDYVFDNPKSKRTERIQIKANELLIGGTVKIVANLYVNGYIKSSRTIQRLKEKNLKALVDEYVTRETTPPPKKEEPTTTPEERLKIVREGFKTMRHIDKRG